MKSSFLVFLLIFHLLRAPVFAQQQPTQLQIVVIQGEGAVNDIKDPINSEVVVEVDDLNDQPVPGATVVFVLPNQGPGGVFANGSKMLTTTTDRQGRATARGIKFTQTGRFNIRVTASNQGATTSATITQTNMSGTSTSTGGLGFGTKAWIILGIAAGAVAATVIYATHHSGSSSSPSTITISPGSPTVGAPPQ